jgi:hypothetical protein
MQTTHIARWSPRDRHEVQPRSWKDELDWCAILGRWLHDLEQHSTRSDAPHARGHAPARLRGAA